MQLTIRIHVWLPVLIRHMIRGVHWILVHFGVAKILCLLLKARFITTLKWNLLVVHITILIPRPLLVILRLIISFVVRLAKINLNWLIVAIRTVALWRTLFAYHCLRVFYCIYLLYRFLEFCFLRLVLIVPLTFLPFFVIIVIVDFHVFIIIIRN